MTVALAREIIFRSGEHLVLVASSVALALLIAMPLGLAIQAHPRWRRLVVGLANAVQTIPSLAIFGLLLTVPLLGGIGSTPAVVALTLYALLPLLRGLLTGLQQVPPGLKQAGQALGLSGGQVLRYVELPLALPSLMAGLRVAAVIAVGVATIGAAIGAGGLGVFIFRGIATVNNTLLLAGALPAAAIALAADACLGALENHLVQGTRQPLHRPWIWQWSREWLRQRWALAAVLLGAALLVVVLSWHQLAPPGPAGSVVIGAKGFTEQQLLGELLAQEIEEHTSLQVRREFSLGSTFLCHEAVRQGRVDGYVEYTGTAWSAILKQPSGPGASDRASLWNRARRLYAERGSRGWPGRCRRGPRAA